ncbi:MAG: hypothetical protein MJ053_01450 [Elusimicrobiaceae bacterium]|nr:hypothetical protein [Elusimicrobiaceae bacterium]
MFKLKPGNVFQKLNTMDRKQAYTWGAVVIVVFIALITLASFLGKADDDSFDGLNARGYDLAQMPFVNDEAEAYLLASKYPDMQGNGATVLYSAAEREAREEADASTNSAASGNEDEDTLPAFSRYQKKDSADGSGNMRSRRGGSSGQGAGAGGGTAVGKLGAANMGRVSGSGVGGSWGAPRGDFSPYKSQEKGKEIPAQLKNQDARKALYQFARGSQAAAGLKDGKGGNARKALMGGNIQGSEAFSDKGVDLSKLGGLALDTNAPTSSADLSNLAKDVSDAANKAENKNKEDNKTLWDKLKEQLLTSLVNIGTQAIGKMVDNGIDRMFASISASGDRSAATSDMTQSLIGLQNVGDATDAQQQAMSDLGIDVGRCGNMSFAACVKDQKPSWYNEDRMKVATRDSDDGAGMNSGFSDPGKAQNAMNKYIRQNVPSFTVGTDDDGNFITRQTTYRNSFAQALNNGSGMHINTGGNSSGNCNNGYHPVYNSDGSFNKCEKNS